VNSGQHAGAGGPGPQVGQHESQFDGFLEAAPDAVVIVDPTGSMVKVNGQTELLFGYRRDELLGAPLEMLMPERYRALHAVRAQAYFDSPHARSMGTGLDLFGLRKDGSEFPIDVSISPFPSDGALFVASTIRDMTTHWQLETELRHRTRELEEADRQKDDYLSAVAHELRTPLSTLTLAAQVLRRSQAHTPLQEQVLEKLERQTAHMARLIEDLLDMTRIRCGTVSLRREPVELRQVVADAIEITQSIVDEHRHHLEYARGAEPLWVSADSTRLVQVVANLLTNAARYTPDGGHIWCSTASEDGKGIIRIRDDGMGIPKEMLSRIFELFTRVPSADGGNACGLGIGLALVRRLVELHGGSVEAISEGSGKGSELIVRLPLSPAAGKAQPA
jgi:protein-histidine pros-kinase